MLTNTDGLLLDENGIVRGIETPISDEPITGFKRIGRHESLYVGPTLQMIQKVRIIRVDDAGQELTDQIRAAVLSPAVAAQLLNAYQDTIGSFSTEGAFVDNLGTPVPELMEGAIEQLAFFQGITLESMGEVGTNPASSLPKLVYQLLLTQIQLLDATGRL